MTDIRQYSKDWFATQGTQKQRNAIKNISGENLEELKTKKELSEYTFDSKKLTGSRKNVQKNFEKIQKNNPEQAEVINKLGGIDNLFDIIDADGNGKISKDEMAKLSAIDTPKKWDIADNETFSANDLAHLYYNVLNSDGAEVVEDDNKTSITYKSGIQTELIRDEEGNLLYKVEKQNLQGNERQETISSYNEKVKKTVIYDSKGRERYEKYDLPGTKKDIEVSTKYGYDRTETKIDTVGRTITITKDKNDDLIDYSQEFKYKLEDSPSQQHSIDDCWLLSQVNGLNNTTIGKQIIDESIIQNDDGTVTVKLQGAGREYTFTPEQICAEEYVDINKRYSTGSAKMKAIELAFTELRKELLDETNFVSFKVQYSYDADKDDPLKTGYFKEATMFLTGVKPETAYKRGNIDNQLTKKQNEPERYAMVTAFLSDDDFLGVYESKKPKIVKNHEYSISRVTENTVYLVNPWDSSEEIAYPREKFVKKAFGTGMADMELYQKTNE